MDNNQLVVTYRWTGGTIGLEPNDINTAIQDNVRLLSAKAGSTPEAVTYDFKGKTHNVSIPAFASAA